MGHKDTNRVIHGLRVPQAGKHKEGELEAQTSASAAQMTVDALLSKPEFWAALFGALAAFLLGALATWWANINAKRTDGNMAIVALSQMCSLIENARFTLLVTEAIRAHTIVHRSPYSFEIRPIGVLPESLPRISADSLGFLADSHDPDILNRVFTAERAFVMMIDLLRRHADLHSKITERLSTYDARGTKPFGPEVLLEVVGGKLLIELDVLVENLEKGLPETRDGLIEVGKQLRAVLRVHIPFRRFVGFSPAPRSRLSVQPPDLPKAALWRRINRWCFDFLFKRRSLLPKAPAAAETDLVPPAIQRFPPRSWETGPSEVRP
jgi:hypothetical protein